MMRESRPKAAPSKSTAGRPDTRQDTAHQLDLDDLGAARAARDAGADAAVNAAHTYWRLAAEAALEDLARSGRPFTAEDLRARVGQLGGHHNSMGGLFIAAARRGVIVPAGFRQATRREAHGRMLRAWVGAA